eukprot:m.60909 g.60909  ORF g.60909 m.60909 type:complete len:403 (-) comp22904_c0_seq1:338-1546(-)
MFLRIVITLTSVVAIVAGHGALFIPTPRNSMDSTLPGFEDGKSPSEACTCNNGNGSPTTGCDRGLRGNADGQSCLWWSQGCSIGCEQCVTETAGTTPISGNPPQAGKIGFGKSYCSNPKTNATLPKHAWTLNLGVTEGSEEDRYRFNPWRAPGWAPVVDACGQAGGQYGYQHLGGDSVFHNTTMAVMGDLGSKLPKGPSMATWKAGGRANVSWGPRYNHGGGYSYRLCAADQALTEECFQQTPLQFDPTAQLLVWNNGSLTFPMNTKGVYVDEGTYPPGSMWARNPLPRIWDSKLGLFDPDSCPKEGPRGPQGSAGCLAFPAPCPWDDGILPCKDEDRLLGRCDGNGMGYCSSDWVVGLIQDTVLIPADLKPGDYVLGWRWDCEETAQIWQNCADVTITVDA